MATVNEYLMHPDEIQDLAPDCRRVLRQEYAAIVGRISMARDPVRQSVEVYGRDGNLVRYRSETVAEARARIAREHPVGSAIAEYRRVAQLWGVVVDRDA